MAAYLFKTVTGDIIIADVIAQTNLQYTLKDAMMLVLMGDEENRQSLGLAPYSPFTEPMNEVKLNMTAIVHGPDEVSKKIKEEWEARKAPQTIMMPKKPGLILPN